MREVSLKIKGRVQGVGFRRWAEKTARKIGGLSGWVRNAEDGSVEIFMRGEEAFLEEMILQCRRGPLVSRVDEIIFLPRFSNCFLPEIIDGVFERI